MTASRALLRLLIRARRTGGDPLAELRDRDYPPPAPMLRALTTSHDVTESVVAGVPVIRLTPRGHRSGQHLIYTHGGGYVRPLLPEHWRMLTVVTRDTGVTVTVPLYRLAPEGCAAQAYPALRAVHEQVAAEAGPDAVTLAGDSAGGGLALGQALDHRDRGIPAVRQVILFAPWLDLELRHPGIAPLVARDPMLQVEPLRAAGRLWARDQDPADPLLSPIRADLAGLPPVHLFQGGQDILAADARDLAVRLRAVGNRGSATWADGGFHVYMAAIWTPESRQVFVKVRELLTPA